MPNIHEIQARVAACKAKADAAPADINAILTPLSHCATAVHLLRTALAAFGDSSEPQAGCDWCDIEEVVGMAKGQVDQFLHFDEPEMNLQEAFDALDLLTVAEHAMNAEPRPANGRTISPISCLLRVASQKLDTLYDSLQSPVATTDKTLRAP